MFDFFNDINKDGCLAVIALAILVSFMFAFCTLIELTKLVAQYISTCGGG